MSNFGSQVNNQLHSILLNTYDKYMVLNLFVDSNDDELKNTYIHAANQHNNKLFLTPSYIDAGFDLFAPGNEGQELQTYGDNLRFFGPNNRAGANPVNKLDFKVRCSAQMVTDNNKTFNTGYYMHPRSSLSKTQLRLANSTGIIDAGYRGHLMAMFDVVNIQRNTNTNTNNNNDCDYYGKKFDRYIQICAPGLVPIVVTIVDFVEDLGEQTERGNGGFGSTGR
jgi:dUTP pyrophosphatase